MNMDGRCQDNNMTTRSTPPGSGTPAESMNAIKNSPGKPNAKRYCLRVSTLRLYRTT